MAPDPDVSLIATCRALYARGLVHGGAGNVSMREDAGMRITASGVCFEAIEADDLVWVSFASSAMPEAMGPRRPSSEWRVHQAVYQACPHVQAIVHAHPPYATAFALVGESLEAPMLSEMVALLGPIPLLPFEPPGSQALADALAQCLKTAHGALLANHGAFVVGADLREAYFRMTLLESQAQTLLYARQLGTPRPLTPDQLARMQADSVG